jgi:hypothetical protein
VWTCDTYELDYVVVDSAVMACGTDPLKPEAAAAYAAGLIDIGRPALSLAHVTKVDDPRYPFGSIFWHNLARMTWSLTGSESEVLLKHRKHNNYPSLGTFALTITWQEGYLREVWERGYHMTILRRVLDALEDASPLSLDQLLGALNDDEHKAVNRKTLQSTLTRALVSTSAEMPTAGTPVLDVRSFHDEHDVLSTLLSICRRLSVKPAAKVFLPQICRHP